MQLKTYQAFTMAQALAAVKRDLGDDAVILNTRTFLRGGVLGIGRRTVVEVTAGLDESDAHPPRPDAARPARQPSTRAQRAYHAGAQPELPTPDADAPVGSGLEAAQKLVESLVGDQSDSFDIASILNDAERDTPTDGDVAAEPSTQRPVTPSADAASTAQRFILTPSQSSPAETQPADKPTSQPPVVTVHAPSAQATDDDATVQRAVAAMTAETRQMQEELEAIRTMVGEVLERQTSADDDDQPQLPQHLLEMYLHLLSQDMSQELADRIVAEVQDVLDETQLADMPSVRQAVLDRVARYIPVAQHAMPLTSPDDRPLTIAMVGPTGVGKTTTIAKLAATYKLRHGRKVGLVTIDTYRIAAVEQLRTYANIIGVPLEVVLTPQDMPASLARFKDCDVVLIDTAGRSQNDDLRLQELRDFLEAARPHQVHLVLSSTADEQVMIREAEAFSLVGVDKILLTKLDEAVNFGVLVSAIHRIGKELSFFTTGQEVPDHIETSRAERLASCVMQGGLSS